ncbi:hypothetical protein N7522_005619 [Penicillium canescens]|nr:hypothetical protein N7522_005619 [Penicillium canescens]
MDSRVVLVTGANAGIGFRRKAPLSLVENEFPSSSNKLFPLLVDIEYDNPIQGAFNEMLTKFGKLDALINNDGVRLDPQLAAGELSQREMWNQLWNINTVGTQIVTSTFIPLLLQSPDPRLLSITSGTSTLAGTENFTLPVNCYSPGGGLRLNSVLQPTAARNVA